MNIAVIYGGESAEHDVSIVTAVQLIKNITKDKNNIIPIYISKTGKMFEVKDYKNIHLYKTQSFNREVCFMPNSMYLYKKNICGVYSKYKKVDFCYIAMHGKGGEDGTMSAVLNMSHIPYSSSGLMGSSVCLDKATFKNAMFGLGVNIVPFITVLKDEYGAVKEELKEKINKYLSYPIIIKPSNLGSSIGINIVNNEKDLDTLIYNSFMFDTMVVIEKYVDIAKEINIALFKYNNEMVFSSFEEVEKQDSILSFDDKYIKKCDNRVIKEAISDELDTKIKDICSLVYKELRLCGVVRFDYILDKDGVLYLNELNTIPGSMANYLYSNRGINYDEMCQMMFREGVREFTNNKKLNITYNSPVLNKINSLKFNK